VLWWVRFHVMLQSVYQYVNMKEDFHKRQKRKVRLAV
jgi:hypothetical protein